MVSERWREKRGKREYYFKFLGVIFLTKLISGDKKENYLKELDDVASTKYTVCNSKLGRFSWREIRCQHTFLCTFSPQNLACSTRTHHNSRRWRWCWWGRRGISGGVRKWGRGNVTVFHVNFLNLQFVPLCLSTCACVF